jgi:hypothetical protein
LRESAEEAAPASAVRPRLISLYDVGVWSYATVVADVIEPFQAVISDPESRELAWVPVDAVDSYPLHPGFAASWPLLRSLLQVHPVVVVDAANVVGSVPDGWWKDRAGATRTAAGAAARTGGARDGCRAAGSSRGCVVSRGARRGRGAGAGCRGGSGRRGGARDAEGDDAIVAEVAALTAAGGVWSW